MPRQRRLVEQGFRRPDRIFQPQEVERLPARQAALNVRQGMGVVAVGDERHCGPTTFLAASMTSRSNSWTFTAATLAANASAMRAVTLVESL